MSQLPLSCDYKNDIMILSGVVYDEGADGYYIHHFVSAIMMPEVN
jgi:hypothetical protein